MNISRDKQLMQDEYVIKRSNNMVLYLIMYLFLLFKAGYFFIESKNVITAPGLLLFIVIVCTMYGININCDCAKVCVIIGILLSITWLIHGFPNINYAIFILLNLVTALLIASLYSRERFLIIYRDMLLYISVASIIGWIIAYFGGISLFYGFPQLINSHQRVGWYGIFTIVSDFSHAGMQRAQGIFWEPGAFQALVCLAMLIEISRGNTKGKLFRLSIFSLALVLCFSTTGYIVLLLSWLVYLNSTESKYMKLLIVALMVVAIFYVFSGKMSGFLKYTIIDKTNEMLKAFRGGTSYNSSVTVRTDSIIVPIKLWVQSPIFGMGQDGVKEMENIVGHTNVTCTPVNYLAEYGVVMCVVSAIGFWRTIKNGQFKSLNKIVVIFTVLVAFVSEDFFLNPILTVFMLYGYKNERDYSDEHILVN